MEDWEFHSVEKIWGSSKARKTLPSANENSECDTLVCVFFLFNPFPDDKILDWSKLKQIADDILKCIWNEK